MTSLRPSSTPSPREGEHDDLIPDPTPDRQEGTAALVAWPGPDPAAVADGFALSATAPHPGVVVVRAIGEIDMLTAPGWARTLDAALRILALETPRPDNRLVCDLTPVTFLGASGLSVLVRAAAMAADDDLGFRVVADHRAVCRPLRLTGLDQQFGLDARLVDAVARDRDDHESQAAS